MKIGDRVQILVNNPIGIESKNYKGLIGKIVIVGEVNCMIEIRFFDRIERWYFRRNDVEVISK